MEGGKGGITMIKVTVPPLWVDATDSADSGPRVCPQDFQDAVHENVRQAIAWFEDSDTSPALRSFALALVPPALRYLPDERVVSDVLAMLHRAVDRGDLFGLSLVFELPRELADRRQASEPALLPLGNHALAVGATEPLLKIAHAAMCTRRMVVPASWIRAILEAESGPDPRDLVVGIVEEWLQREGADPDSAADVLSRRPAIQAQLLFPEVPGGPR
jgi:hypothetical protein